MENYKEKYEQAMFRMNKWVEGSEIIEPKEVAEFVFPELKENKDEEKPNGGIVSEDFNEGEGFYKVNLAYLNKEQVIEIEELVKKWNPDLKESEEEKIRKVLLNEFIHLQSKGYKFAGLEGEEIIAWLEKQGEQKFPSLSEKEIVCLKRTLDFLREEHNSYTGKDFTNEIAVLEWLITHPVLIHPSELQQNQGEQKKKQYQIYERTKDRFYKEGVEDGILIGIKKQNPAWSEEDEKLYTWCASAIQTRYNDGLFTMDEYRETSLWLKSLKERMKGE